MNTYNEREELQIRLLSEGMMKTTIREQGRGGS